ncbi:MAG: sugar phosphate isomerase/epimerase family protein [Anaerolineae bacterium]|jgi:inosose dehydratase|nr:TIM barrel protein [Chloroflexota bacterium]
MSNYIIAFSGITWGRDYDRDQMLAEIKQAGYEGSPAGVRPGTTAAEVKAQFERHGLRPGPGYIGANWWDPALTAELMERAKEQADNMAELGVDAIFIADGGFQNVTPSGRTRRDLATHTTAADSLSPDQYKYYGEVISKVGEETLKRGVMACFHNHVGSYIETRKEIDDLWAQVDRSKVFQGPDIGHLAWAGGDVLDFCRTYAQDIKCLHVKDINGEVLKKGLPAGWTYGEYSQAGIFAELGEGIVPVPGMLEILNGAGYKGWFIVEIDRTMKPSALESALVSRAYLRSIGY